MNFQRNNRNRPALPIQRGGFGNGLSGHLISQVDSRLAGKSAGSALALFDTITAADVGPFVRNTDFWAADMVEKLTCICPSTSANSLFCLGTAITPRHILYHKHGGALANGSTMRFVTSDNTIVLRTQDQTVSLTVADMIVGLLSSDLPATITPCPIAPDNFKSYMGFTPRPPVLILDQEAKGLVHDMKAISGPMIFNEQPANAQRLAFYEVTVTNDSGKGWFTLINDQLVMLGVHRSVTDGFGVMGFNSAINAAIVAVDALGGVSTGFTVTNPNLSNFNVVS